MNIFKKITRIGGGEGDVLGCKGFYTEFNWIFPKTVYVEIFSSHIFCSSWYIIFSSTMLPYTWIYKI